MKFSEMPYKRIVLEEYKEQAGKIFDNLKNAETPDDAVKSFFDMQDLNEKSFSMSSISYIRHSIDTNDEFYDKENDYYDEVSPYFSEIGIEFNKELFNSRHREALEERLGSLMFENIELALKTFKPEIIPDLQEENKLVSEYGKLLASAQIEFDGKVLSRSELGAYKIDTDRDVRKNAYIADAGFLNANKAQLDEIFDKLVKVRTKIAHTLGFENFVELGYCRMTRNSYNIHDIERFRNQVKEILVPVTSVLKEQQKKRLGLEDDFKLYDDGVLFKDGNAKPYGTPEEIMENGRKMYEELSSETSEFMNFMLDNELFDVLSRKGKMGGGYCAYIGIYKSPFIFANFNGTSGDIDVLTHEAGHAFAAYYSRDAEIASYRSPTAESCEIHSMAMEFFTWAWMDKFFRDRTAKYKYSNLAQALSFIPYGTIVDYFQHIIYEKPELTPAQRCEEWGKLEKMFRPWIDAEDMPYYGESRRWQTQMHIYEMPFYYIDYCLAQTIALAFWSIMQSGEDNSPESENFKDAWAKYMTVIKAGGAKKFTELVETANMPNPFKEGSMSDMAAIVMKWIEQNEIQRK